MRKRPVDAALTLGDRLEYACIAACAGLVIGAGAALVVPFFVGSTSWGIVAFSIAYFFAIGFVQGPVAGDFAGDALSVVFGAGAATAEIAPDGLAAPNGRTAMALIGIYIACVVLLAWFL